MRILELVRTVVGVAGMALSLGGCGSGAAAGASGDRIQLKVIEGTDGSRVLLGLYDSELKTDCVYTTAADGKLRCLPLPSDKLKLIWSGDIHFSDPDCTMAVAEWEGGLTATGDLDSALPPFGVVVFDDDPDLELTHVYPVQGRYEGDGHGSHHDVTDDYCSSYSLDPDVHYIQLGAEMPATRFVEGTEVIE